MFLYTNNITPRLEYISDFLGKELLGEAFVLTTDKEGFGRETMPGVNYSKERIKENEFRVEPYSLLFKMISGHNRLTVLKTAHINISFSLVVISHLTFLRLPFIC